MDQHSCLGQHVRAKRCLREVGPAAPPSTFVEGPPSTLDKLCSWDVSAYPHILDQTGWHGRGPRGTTQVVGHMCVFDDCEATADYALTARWPDGQVWRRDVCLVHVARGIASPKPVSTEVAL